MPAGRPPIYTVELADTICERIAGGQSLRSILKEDGMPSMPTVMRWLLNIPEFDTKYARARQMQAEVLADEMLDIADDSTNDYMDKKGKEGGVEVNQENIQRSKLRLEQRRWYAEKLRPKVYGPKIAIGGTPDLPPIQMTNHLEISHLSLEELEALGSALQKSMIKDE